MTVQKIPPAPPPPPPPRAMNDTDLYGFVFLYMQVGLERDELETDTTYRSLLGKLPEGPVYLQAAYAAIEEKVAKMDEYVQVWLQYQSLWDMDMSMVYNRLGENMEKWMVLLKDIK